MKQASRKKCLQANTLYVGLLPTFVICLYFFPIEFLPLSSTNIRFFSIFSLFFFVLHGSYSSFVFLLYVSRVCFFILIFNFTLSIASSFWSRIFIFFTILNFKNKFSSLILCFDVESNLLARNFSYFLSTFS